MKTIGLIGGMSWESTVTYYQIINQVVNDNLGGLHSAKILLYSVDFDEIEKLQAAGNWEKNGEMLSEIANTLEQAGADFILICTNTMHKVADKISNSINIPILHIAECAADVLLDKNIKKVGLLGTKYTMEQEFYKSKLVEKGIEVIIPVKKDREIINDIIFNELCLGKILDTSKTEYLRIIDELSKNGAEGIVLGCTEIGLLVQEQDTDIPLFDTAYIHAKKGALYSIE